jgi:tetratricopeptide (TPR) repeat protein
MRKLLIGLAMLLVPATVLAAPQPAPQSAPQRQPSNEELATALCDSPDATPDQTIAGCGALIKAGILKGADLADAYNNRADGYLAQKKYDLAIADENQAIPLDAGNANALNNRCLAYIGKKDYDKAIADCSQAIRVNSGFAHYYRNRATALLDKGKRAEALADLRTAIKLDPQDQYAVRMLMSFAAKQEEGGAHIVDARHPAPAALAARFSGEATPPAKPSPAKPAAAPKAAN